MTKSPTTGRRGRPTKTIDTRLARMPIFLEPDLIQFVTQQAAQHTDDRGDIKPISPSAYIRSLIVTAEIQSRII